MPGTAITAARAGEARCTFRQSFGRRNKVEDFPTPHLFMNNPYDKLKLSHKGRQRTHRVCFKVLIVVK